MSFLKFKNWEYWPSSFFYIPNIPYAIYLAIKAKNIVFFSATNPAIKHSGNGSESKFSTHKLIPENFKPVSILFEAKNSIENALKTIKQHQIKFPLIIKPAIGFRGLLVQKIDSENDLINYLKKYQKFDLIIQEFVDFDNECGIFYHRIPTEKKGKVTSVTLKKFIAVTGDGFSTIKQLINQNNRAKKYTNLLYKLNNKKLDFVLNKGEIKILNVIGNHSKGTQFINGNYLINNELESAINSIMKQIPNWYYGRLDIKYRSYEELLQLKNFKIIELNGIISEPTHIYDATQITYFKALKSIREHWKIMFKISTTNHIKKNIKYDNVYEFLKSLIKLRKYTKQIKSVS